MSNPRRPSPPQLVVKRQLLFCVEKLLNVISRRQRDLRNKCIDVQKEIKGLTVDPANGDKYWLIFQMSCQSQVPPIVEVALDSIQKLMASSILTGQTQDRNGKPLIDSMVKTICDCCAIESEKVQLQIVKAILTLGTSPSCEVHGQSLLMCLRACYNIFLSTKNIDVQTSAKAVLTQIVCAVFQRMEKTQQASMKKQSKHSKSEIYLLSRSIVIGLANDISIAHQYKTIVPYQSSKELELKEDDQKSPDMADELENEVKHDNDAQIENDKEAGNDNENQNDNVDAEPPKQAAQEQEEEDEQDSKDKEKDKEPEPQNAEPPALASADEEPPASEPPPKQEPSSPESPRPKSPASVSSKSSKSSRSKPKPKGKSKSASPKSRSEDPDTIKRGKFGWCVVCGSSANHYCIQTRDPVCSLDCKMENLQNCIDFLRQQENTMYNDTIMRLELAYKSTVLTNDGHILFRALCRQALKTLPTDNMMERDTASSWLDFTKIPRLFDPHSAMKPLALKSKVLSLELLRLVFSNTGHTFKSSHRFIDAVRECFVPVVTENAVSTVENIFQLAVNMFALLVEGYRKYLKNEIGVLLDNVFLQIAESPHSNFKQKKMALTVFNKIDRKSVV